MRDSVERHQLDEVGLIIDNEDQRWRHAQARVTQATQRSGSRNTSAEQTAAAGARLVEKSSAVGLRKLARQEQAQAGAVLIAREERLEDLFAMLHGDAGAAVGHFEERPRGRGHAAHAQLDDLGVRFLRRRTSRRSRTGSRRSGAAATGRPGLPRRRAARKSTVRSGLICMVAQNSSRKPSSQVPSTRRSGREFSRRAMDMTFSMICRTRSPLVRMISVSRLSSAESYADFAQQLRRVAHGADRVADLVRDAGATAGRGPRASIAGSWPRAVRCLRGTR